MESIADYREAFLAHLRATRTHGEPETLYGPMHYILDLGGKRLRPVLTLMCCELFGGEARQAMGAAMAIETFHNFSLVHDDIMDRAPLRRGRATVHEKWGLNTGILSGDALLVQAYQHLEGYPPELFKVLASLFGRTAMQVCQGQQYDLDFEDRTEVSIPQYLKMIECKTAVLVAAAMKMGALIAGAVQGDADALYGFGLNLGMAFQLQDDYLDLYGDPESFGKQLGGDVLENKKTYLYLKALEGAGPTQRERLLELYATRPLDGAAKIEEVRTLFGETGSVEAIQSAIGSHTRKAIAQLDRPGIPDTAKIRLEHFGQALMARKV